MKLPSLDLIPLRPAVCSDAPTTLDILLRIRPPELDVPIARPVLNLALVLDRSGSMAAHNKIAFAREAAAFAVEQLLPTDRVSLTIFDNKVRTLAPNALVENKQRLLELIRGIEPGGSTALHGGWHEGALQVRSHLVPGGLNRVLLLSDGLANAGQTEPDAIATEVHQRAGEGVSTTTLGLGDDYNEDLLEAMARSGDGNYYYIESPEQLPRIFQAELQGLVAAFGNAVTLTVEPCEGATVLDVLNDLDRLPDGRFKLPNLVMGMPVQVLVRLKVPPQSQERELCRFRLEWTAPGEAGRQALEASLRLPAVPATVWESLAPSVEVQEQVALLVIARCKREATRCLERGDAEAAKRWVHEAKQILMAAPGTAELQREADEFAQLEAYIDSGAWARFTKSAKYQSYRTQQSKIDP